MYANSPATQTSRIRWLDSIFGSEAPAGGVDSAANAALSIGGRLGTRKTTSSVISSRTAAVSPAAVASRHWVTSLRIAASSSDMKAS